MSQSLQEKDLAFPVEEFRRRLGLVQREVKDRGLDATLVFGPANLFYLTGYETIGFSNYQLAVVTPDAEPRLLVRELESAPARRLAWLSADPVPWEDHQDPLLVTAEMLRDASRVPYVRETGAKFANMDPRLRSSIVATVTQRFDIFRTGGAANATSTSDFEPQLLRKRDRKSVV